jgi:hypothetical protein
MGADKNSIQEPMIPRSLGDLRELLLPNPRGHLSATRPRIKMLANHSRKHAVENNLSTCCRSKTGQVGFSNLPD